MSARSFTVFRDAPTAKPPTLRPLGRSASAAAVLTTSHRSENDIVSLPEKENLLPLTGFGTRSAPLGKKRKASESASVLATKVLTVAEASDTAKSKPKRTDLKRKASSQAASGRTKLKRENSKKNTEDKVQSAIETASSSARKTPSRAGLRSSPTTFLEPIIEEVATQVADEEKLSSDTQSLVQAVIDSRCYELTVSPLADISGAYLQSSEPKKDETKDEDLPEYRTVKEESGFATQIRDYFLSEGLRAGSESSAPSSTNIATSLFGVADDFDVRGTAGFLIFDSESSTESTVPLTPKKPHRLVRSLSLPSTPSTDSAKDKEDVLPPSGPLMLSTPERKELYATFTFTTPKSSPARTTSII